VTCPVCGREHSSLFCPPERPAKADPATCEHPMPWRQVGRCVYCGSCDVRLYQGRVAKDERERRELLAWLEETER